MNLKKICGHTIDVDLLPQSGWVLDVGCRDFGFSREILRLRGGMLALAFDPDPEVKAPSTPRIAFASGAVTGAFDGQWAFVAEGEASHLIRFGERPKQTALSFPVYCVSIGNLVSGGPAPLGTWLPKRYAVVKLDCEGSEFEILEHWPYRMADQISVEFHDYLDRRRWNDDYFKALFDGPLMNYRVVQHELTPVGPGNTLSHWDSLLVLRDL